MKFINFQYDIMPEASLILASLIIYLVRKNTNLIILALLAMAAILVSVFINQILNSGVYGYVAIQVTFTVILVCACFYALAHKRPNEICAGLLYGGSAIYLLRADNLLTFFCLIEIMLVAGSYIIFNAGTKSSRASGLRYLKMHIVAGTFILLGVIDHYETYGNFILGYNNFYKISIHDPETYKHGFLAIGLLINSAMLPFSAWLPDSYPRATCSGSLLLSIFTTKISLFFLAKIYWGEGFLTYFGVLTIIYAAIYLLLENNLRRTSSYYMILQNGIIVCLISIGSTKMQQYFPYILSCSAVYCFYMMYITSYLASNQRLSYFTDIKNSTRVNEISLILVLSFFVCIGFPYTVSYISKYFMLVTAKSIVLEQIMYLTTIAVSIGTIGKASCYFSFTRKIAVKEMLQDNSLFFFVMILMLILGGIGSFVFEIKSTNFYLFKRILDLFAAIIATKLLFRLVENKKYQLSLDIDWIYRRFLMGIYKMFSLALLLLKKLAIKRFYQYKNFFAYWYADYLMMANKYVVLFSLSNMVFYAIILLLSVALFF
ncbi:MAG: proton-conducting transporter membrane subunit [Rickettsiales bacterium]